MEIIPKKCKIIIFFFVIILFSTIFIINSNVEVNKQLNIQLIEKDKEIKKNKFDEYKQEKYDVLIDEYNFEQLGKIKEILSNNSKAKYNFHNLKKFNENYNSNIKTIKNCYYIVSTNYFDKYNNWLGYMFWFKLESNKYKNDFWNDYYSYPKYDLPILGDLEGDDINNRDFMWIILNPCSN